MAPPTNFAIKFYKSSNNMALFLKSFLICMHLPFAIGQFETESVRTCEPIRHEPCKNLGYNVTGFPNLADLDSQLDAVLLIKTFTPLIRYDNSERLIFFLCSVYFPMCTEKVSTLIGPCRPLCESLRDRYTGVLNRASLSWPLSLNCSKFPKENNRDHMCMEGPVESEDRTLPPIANPGFNLNGYVHKGGNELFPPRGGYNFNNNNNKHGHFNFVHDASKGGNDKVTEEEVDASMQNYKPCMDFQYKNYKKYTYINRTDRCALLCGEDDVFSEENKTFANVWMAIWTGLCFVSSLFTILTFLIDSQRFRYPERPIILMAMCFNFYSIAYIVRFIAGRDDIACTNESQSGKSILTQEGLENTDCAIVFLLLYYFGTASALWWVVLTFTWFLAVALKRTHESIHVHSSYYHLVAWSVPAVQTIVILVMRDVDADELTGLCYVGNQSTGTLMAFIIAPNIVYLIIGCAFLFTGFMYMIRLQSPLPYKPDANASSANEVIMPSSSNVSGNVANHRSVIAGKEDRLQVLLVRIGIFSLLYTVPATCVIGCLIYEYKSRESWYKVGSNASPVIGIFMLKIFMTLVVGITTGVWVCSTKTLRSWRYQLDRFTNNKNNRKTVEYTASSGSHQYHQVPIKTGSNGPRVPPNRTIRSGNKSKRSKSDGETIV